MEKETKDQSEWQTKKHALRYLSRAHKLPHRTEGEKVLLDQIPQGAERVLDLGSGDGRLLSLVMAGNPSIKEGVALDFSDPMITRAKTRFQDDKRVRIVKHDFSLPLPEELGCFDAVVSSLAIHHLTDERKRQLYTEVFCHLNPGGVFCNLEHVSSPTERLHRKFFLAIGQLPQNEDPSNKLLDVETQLRWLGEIGFLDVDCYWKWLEVALLVGVKP
ncbi:MAG: class I SAM-dependent methyltransferase [Candidatus Bathyarchaeia archaeon]